MTGLRISVPTMQTMSLIWANAWENRQPEEQDYHESQQAPPSKSHKVSSEKRHRDKADCHSSLLR